MNSKTHMYVGAAAALAVLRPAGIGNCLVDIAGGMLGGWLCDTDLNTMKDKTFRERFSLSEIAVPLVAVMVTDWFFGFGICNYLVKNFNYQNLVGLAAFFLIATIGATKTSHREFMHSLLAVITFSVVLAFVFPPIVLPFAIGMVLHILLDLTNKQGVQLLFPLSFKPCLNLCDSDGVADRIIRYLALASTIVLAVWLLAGGTLDSSNLGRMVAEAQQRISLFGLTSFQVYVIAINIATFLFGCYDYQRFNHNLRMGKGETVFDTVNTHICNFLTIVGGALGMLVSLVLCNLDTKLSWADVKDVDIVRQGDSGNAWWYVLVASSLLAWVGIYVAVVNPLGMEYRDLARFRPLDHLGLICGWLLVNIITFCAFWADRNHKRRRFDRVQFLLLLLCAAGGSLGGLIAMALTRKKEGSGHFAYGVPALLVTNVITAVILVLTGIA